MSDPPKRSRSKDATHVGKIHRSKTPCLFEEIVSRKSYIQRGRGPRTPPPVEEVPGLGRYTSSDVVDRYSLKRSMKHHGPSKCRLTEIHPMEDICRKVVMSRIIVVQDLFPKGR